MKYDSDVFRSRQNPAFGLKKGKVDIIPNKITQNYTVDVFTI